MKPLCLIVFLIVGALPACTKETATMTVNQMPVNATTLTPPSGSISYLALGDSYTIGESVLTADSFPYQLAAQLNSNNYNVTAPTIIAATGWTTDNLINIVNKSGITYKRFDFVTLLIGVNDQYQGLSQTNYRIKFAQILDSAIVMANHKKSRVFVLSIPDYDVTPFGAGNDNTIAPQIAQFNAINRDESQKAGVNYVNITDISMLAATNASLTANDGLHPSRAMYNLWVQSFLSSVTYQLSN